VHLHEIMMKVRKAEKELANDLRREPTKQEVANKAGISEAKLHGLHKVTASWHCLTMPWVAAKSHVFQSSKFAGSAHGSCMNNSRSKFWDVRNCCFGLHGLYKLHL